MESVVLDELLSFLTRQSPIVYIMYYASIRLEDPFFCYLIV